MNQKIKNYAIPNRKNILEAFQKLNEIITQIASLDLYNESKLEYLDLLLTIKEWEKNYKQSKTLSEIGHKDLLAVYSSLDNLQTKYVYYDTPDPKTELSDDVVNWMWRLMVLRKNEIEKEMQK